MLKTSHQPQLVILPCQRSTLCYHTGLFRAEIHFKTDQLRKCHKILFTTKKSLQHQRCCRLRAKQGLGFFAKWFCGGKSCKITLKEHISSNCHQKAAQRANLQQHRPQNPKKMIDKSSISKHYIESLKAAEKNDLLCAMRPEKRTLQEL